MPLTKLSLRIVIANTTAHKTLLFLVKTLKFSWSFIWISFSNKRKTTIHTLSQSNLVPRAFSLGLAPKPRRVWDVHPRQGEPRHSEPRHSEPRHSEPRHSEPRHSEFTTQATTTITHSEPQHSDAQDREPQHIEPQHFVNTIVTAWNVWHKHNKTLLVIGTRKTLFGSIVIREA